MPTYEFVIQGENVGAQPKVRVTTLSSDNAAWDHAEAIIRKLQHDDPRAEDHRVLVISSSERVSGVSLSIWRHCSSPRRSIEQRSGDGTGRHGEGRPGGQPRLPLNVSFPDLFDCREDE